MIEDEVAAARLREAGCVFAQDEVELLREVAAGDANRFHDLLERRVAGGALEHVVGFAQFLGRRFVVEPGVFVPRQRSDLLVDVACELAEPGMVVVEPCCGCGAIGATIAREVGGVVLHATEIDPVAARCARENLGTLGSVVVGDLFEPLPAGLQGEVDLVVANAPYVPSAEVALLPRDVRASEPLQALDGGDDGLDLARRIAVESTAWLRHGGSLVVEASEAQAALLREAFEDAGLVAYVRRDAEADATAVVGRYAVGGTGLS